MGNDEVRTANGFVCLSLFLSGSTELRLPRIVGIDRTTDAMEAFIVRFDLGMYPDLIDRARASAARFDDAPQ
jgi:predicted PilT family ATPase